MLIPQVCARSSTPPIGASKSKRGENLVALRTKDKKMREMRRAASKKGAVARRQKRLQQQQQQQQQDERASPAAAAGLSLPGEAAILYPAPDAPGLAAAAPCSTSPVAVGTPALPTWMSQAALETRSRGKKAAPAQRPKPASRPVPTEGAASTCLKWGAPAQRGRLPSGEAASQAGAPPAPLGGGGGQSAASPRAEVGVLGSEKQRRACRRRRRGHRAALPCGALRPCLWPRRPRSHTGARRRRPPRRCPVPRPSLSTD